MKELHQDEPPVTVRAKMACGVLGNEQMKARVPQMQVRLKHIALEISTFEHCFSEIARNVGKYVLIKKDRIVNFFSTL